VPTPIDNRHVRQHDRQRAPQHQRTVANVVLVDFVGDVDDQRPDAMPPTALQIAADGSRAPHRKGDTKGVNHARARMVGRVATVGAMTASADRAGKWDRAARYLKIAMILRDHPDGISAQALADRIGVSKRTVYRDVLAMDMDAGLPIWNDGGRFGLEREAFLPPLALTLHEATTLFLAARMLAKASDEHDTELIGAFVKLAQILPPVLAQHIEATVDAFSTPPNDRFTRVFRVLARRGPDGEWWRSSTTRAFTTRPRGRAERASGRSRSNRPR
jgi:hypothetical protein